MKICCDDILRGALQRPAAKMGCLVVIVRLVAFARAVVFIFFGSYPMATPGSALSAFPLTASVGSIGRIGRYIFRLVRERRAVAAVEFAVLLTPLAAMLFASLQIPLIFFADQALQSAAITAGRQIMTGSAQQSNVSQGQFQAIVCSLLSSVFSCGQLMVDVESASSFGSINTASPTLTYGNGAVTNQWAYNPGGPGDVVIVRVMYNWPVVGSSLIPGLANQPNNSRLLVGTTVFKNEPYQ